MLKEGIILPNDSLTYVPIKYRKLPVNSELAQRQAERIAAPISSNVKESLAQYEAALLEQNIRPEGYDLLPVIQYGRKGDPNCYGVVGVTWEMRTSREVSPLMRRHWRTNGERPNLTSDGRLIKMGLALTYQDREFVISRSDLDPVEGVVNLAENIADWAGQSLQIVSRETGETRFIYI